MCDTFCSLSGNNKNPKIGLFGKNSDRDPNEAQVVEFYPREKRDGKVHTTYIEVHYDGDTNAIVISRPYWMWGAEMGVNEKGVAIGNEAIFSKPKNKNKSLLGMDLLRLGLEKGTDPANAAKTMIGYLEEYGQGGSNDKFKNEYYNNSYLISDGKQALELYFVGREYELKEVKNFDAISNSIPEEREGEKSKIVSSGNYHCSQDWLYTTLGRGRERSEFTTRELERKSGHVTLEEAFQMLRHHDGDWSHPREGSNSDICMHAGPFSRRFQTVNSIVAEVNEGRAIVWSTFSSNPCISLYKPVLFSEEGAVGLGYDIDYWKRVEKIHRIHFDQIASKGNETGTEVHSLQSQIMDLSEDIRYRWLLGESVSSNDIEKVIRSIKQIDERYITALEERNRLSGRMPVTLLYGNWWRKRWKTLEQVK